MPLTIRVHERLNEAFSPKTVKIGSQIWMAENLSVNDGGKGIKVKGNDVFYTWDAAMRVASSISGWHLPSQDEFEELIEVTTDSYRAGRNLKSADSWKDDSDFTGLQTSGLDNFGFSARAVGYIDNASGDHFGVGRVADFWSSTDRDYKYYKAAYNLSLSHDSSSAYLARNDIDFGYSVRLIKD